MAKKEELLKDYVDLTGEDFGEGTIAEIEQAIADYKRKQPAPAQEEAEGKYVATSVFRDKLNKKVTYKEGDTIGKMDKATLQARLDAGLIKKA